jgi:hypothetical protein
MKKYIILIVLVILPVMACAQTVSTEPITIEWDSVTQDHEVAIQSGTGDIILLGETAANEYYIDLQSSGHYGVYTILIRGFVIFKDDRYYTEWSRSDSTDDVIMVDGVPQTVTYISIEKPKMLRIK